MRAVQKSIVLERAKCPNSFRRDIVQYKAEEAWAEPHLINTELFKMTRSSYSNLDLRKKRRTFDWDRVLEKP